MNNFKVIKLDRRYKGHDFYTHAIDFNVMGRIDRPSWAERIENFVDTRIWFWDTFGPSCELEAIYAKKYDRNWSWYCVIEGPKKCLKIYIKDDPVLSHFLLKQSY